MLRILTILMSLALFGCVQISLAPPPNLYRTGANYPAESLPLILRTAEPKIFYVTDRERNGQSYNSSRSEEMAFGYTTVKFGRDLDWPELLERTRADSQKRISTLWVPEIEEVVRFPKSPLPFIRVNDQLQTQPAAQAEFDKKTRAFQQVIQEQLDTVGTGRVLVYVHGYNNAFEDSVTALANLWHFAGRSAVPIAFTWPSGNGAGVLGYFRDRDAGAYSVLHTKQFFRMLAAMPDVKTIDIVAHSQGTAVATTALRELVIAERAAGRVPRDALKTGTLILAAPDLDAGIVKQRLIAERFSDGFQQINLYLNPNDIALHFSRILSGQTRLGAVTDDDFSADQLEDLRLQAQVHLIQVEQARNRAGHSYFRQNPAVLSDIVLALRTGAQPGEAVRPLERDKFGFWLLHSNYPLDRLPEIGIELDARDRDSSR